MGAAGARVEAAEVRLGVGTALLTSTSKPESALGIIETEQKQRRPTFSTTKHTPPKKRRRSANQTSIPTGNDNSGGGGGEKPHTDSSTTHTIVVSGKTADAVDGFIAAAWSSFRDERRKKKKDESRYLYMPVLSSSQSGGPEAEGATRSRWAYKRWVLFSRRGGLGRGARWLAAQAVAYCSRRRSTRKVFEPTLLRPRNRPPKTKKPMHTPTATS